jgi:hypothetical protein
VQRSKSLKQQAKKAKQERFAIHYHDHTKDHHPEVRADGREKEFSRGIGRSRAGAGMQSGLRT